MDGGMMNKQKYLMKRWNERMLQENASYPNQIKKPIQTSWRKSIFRMSVTLIAFPIAGAIGGFLIWSFIKLISGLSGNAGIN